MTCLGGFKAYKAGAGSLILPVANNFFVLFDIGTHIHALIHLAINSPLGSPRGHL